MHDAVAVAMNAGRPRTGRPDSTGRLRAFMLGHVKIDAYADGEWIVDRPGRQLAILGATPELTLTWTRHGPGEEGTALHVHREHTDAFYVLQGELTLPHGPDGAPLPAAAGSFVSVPPGVVHAFVNASDAPVAFLNLHLPDAGFAEFLRGSAEPWDSFAPPQDGGLPASAVTVGGVELLAAQGVTVLHADLESLQVEID